MKKFIVPLLLMSPVILYALFQLVTPIIMMSYMFGGGMALAILGTELLCIIGCIVGFVMVIRRIGT